MPISSIPQLSHDIERFLRLRLQASGVNLDSVKKEELASRLQLVEYVDTGRQVYYLDRQPIIELTRKVVTEDVITYTLRHITSIIEVPNAGIILPGPGMERVH